MPLVGSLAQTYGDIIGEALADVYAARKARVAEEFHRMIISINAENGKPFSDAEVVVLKEAALGIAVTVDHRMHPPKDTLGTDFKKSKPMDKARLVVPVIALIIALCAAGMAYVNTALSHGWNPIDWFTKPATEPGQANK